MRKAIAALEHPPHNRLVVWHVDCIERFMTDDERHLVLLIWTICVLMFACGVVAITEHPEWFGA
jgi:hypothetical protein